MYEIANSDSHTLTVNPIKNRIYCTMTGNSFPEKATFIQDWKQATCSVSEGFTVLFDVSRFRLMSLGWLETSLRIQKILQNAGLAATAEIVPEHVLSEMQFYDLSDVEEKKLFTDSYKAEAWLDSVNTKIAV
jgi:hypothetical protein